MPEGYWGTQTWTSLDVPCIYSRSTGEIITGTVARGGMHLVNIARWCIPDEDRAEFYIDTGLIDGVTVTAPDLTNKVIRIQVYDDEDAPNGWTTLPTTGWKTVFVGSMVETHHVENVGLRQNGRTTYYCAGPSMRLRMWPLDRHACGSVTHAKGHPGYNVPLHGLFRQVIGNLDTSGSVDPIGDLTGSDMDGYYRKHALPVSRNDLSKWTDVLAVKHALASSRAAGEMLIRVDLDNGLFDGTFSWPVNPGDSAWDLLRRICNRQRGRGAVFFEYEDADTGTGNVTVVLKARAPFANEVLYRQAADGVLSMDTIVTIPPAEDGVDAIDVDLNGDHRIAEPFTYVDRYSSLIDHLVVQGEPIQVCCNLNFFGSTLANRWSATDQTTFAGLTELYQRQSPRWRHVWRRYGLPETFTLNVKAEPAAAAKNIDYALDGTGTIVANSDTTDRMTFRILGDLPIYEGWRYDQTVPVRWDAATDYLPPVRMSPVVMIRADADKDTDPTWYPLHYAGFNLQFDDYGLYIVNGVEDQGGVRLLASAAAAPNAYQDPQIPGVTATSGIDQQKLNTIVGVELGARVAFSTQGPYDNAGKRMVMTVPGVHLWLGAPGAIWELDYLRAGQANYSPGLKFPSSEAAYIIRDDRNALAFIHALAASYYTQLHNPGQWALADCGFLSSFSTLDGGAVSYPQLGQLVGEVTYAGEQGSEQTTELNTPITSIFYEHDRGVTTWRTDFVSYDGSNQ